MHGTLNDQSLIYLQIARMLEDDILRGVYREEEQVPSTNELAREYNINPATAAKGINLLVAEGVLYKWGAAPSYLKKGGNVKKIGTASPPPGLGVGEEHRAGGVRLSLQRGELLVLTTDGVPEAACEQYLRTCGALSPRELAAGVVACASESEPDDRTAVIVQLDPASMQPHHTTRRARSVSKSGAEPHI